MDRTPITPDQAFLLLEGPAGKLRDALRRAFLRSQNDEEIILWLGFLMEAFVERHPRHVAQLQLLIAELAKEKAAAVQARTS